MRTIVYEMKDGTTEVFRLNTVEDEQHERAQAEHELHSRDTQVVGYRFEEMFESTYDAIKSGKLRGVN